MFRVGFVGDCDLGSNSRAKLEALKVIFPLCYFEQFDCTVRASNRVAILLNKVLYKLGLFHIISFWLHADILALCQRCDAVIFTSVYGFPISKVTKTKVKLIFITNDNPTCKDIIPNRYAAQMRSKFLLICSDDYSHLPMDFDPVIFVPRGFSEWRLRRFELGRAKLVIKSDAMICFVGSFETERSILIRELAEICQVDVFGNGWGKFSHPNCRVCGPVYDLDYIETIRSYKLCLSFFRKARNDRSTSRIFEIPGYGGFLVAERSSYTDQIYGDIASKFSFQDAASLVFKVRSLLSLDQADFDDLKLMQRKIASNYTYENILSAIELNE